MAVSTSFYLAYTDAYIKQHQLDEMYVSIRCEMRYTADALPWAISRSLGRPVTRVQFTLDLRAMPKYWNRGRVNAKHPDAPIINGRIDTIAQRAQRLHAEYLAAGEIPGKSSIILDLLGKGAAAQAGGFFDDYERYISYCRGRTSKSFADAQALTLRRIKEFERWRGLPVAYEAINKTWAHEFAQWLTEGNAKGKRLGYNTGNKHLKALKMFLNHATLEGWNKYTYYKQIKIQERREAFPVTLEEREILALWNITDADLHSIGPKEKNVILHSRDWFVLATQTALRFSDWDAQRIRVVTTPDGGKNFQLYQKKTIQAVEVPLSDLAAKVLARHGGSMPKALSPAPTLKHIAKLCKLAGIHKDVTTHTARRTFATLQERAGVPRSVIMRITGHRTERDYLKYVGVTFEHNADMLRKANPDWFKEAG